MNRSENKAGRLLQIEALLLAHPQGMTQAELARRLGVNRSTIHRCLPDLPGVVYVDEQQRWRIDRDAYLVQVRFNLHEALALHLAARLLAQRMERQNPNAAAAMRKLSLALDRLAPRISQQMRLSADMMDDESRLQDPVYLGVLAEITRGWAAQRKLRIFHRHAESGRIRDYVLAPYFIEPNAIGQSTYVIGWREPPGAVRTFKIERIERAEVLDEAYELPPDLDLAGLLKNAWGIWFTERDPVEVALCFSQGVARRVGETRWHPSERVLELDDGSLLWRAQVAEPQEMLPWIRGWGADVEVLEPESLRLSIAAEIERMRGLYQR